jgi:hypothetical protein
MEPRVLATRTGQCTCGRKVKARTIATDVDDAIPIEIYQCAGCDRVK